ncbi:MAG: prepilin-type N-terminal cleavage/methylation domain-containing protein [Myxococcota bacterium]|nr:prepilin-type N-terminal cleavage/methylation domain-containing protein [Myxococcota bacterium]
MARSPRTILGAFTLLEVMVAVAILAIALTAIFSSQAGAIRVASRARFTTTATLLARCKMAEIEEQTMRDGLPAVSATGTDECCEEGEVEGFECEWEISRIVLPDQAALGEEEGGGGPLAGLAGAGEEGAEPPGVEDIMGGMMGGGDMMSELAMQYAFPVIKPQIEEQVRRARVTVSWHEGERRQSFDVVQFLVAEQLPAALTNQAAEQAIQGMTGGAGAGGLGGGAGGGGAGGGATPPPGQQGNPGL